VTRLITSDSGERSGREIDCHRFGSLTHVRRREKAVPRRLGDRGEVSGTIEGDYLVDHGQPGAKEQNAIVGAIVACDSRRMARGSDVRARR